MAENDSSATPAAATENAADQEVKTMRSLQLTGYGGIKMVKFQTVPQVTPKEGEVLIRVKACGLNFLDLILRQGAMETPPKTPFTMGFECCGEVEALGENVDRFNIGDRVIGICDTGAWAELACVPAQFVYPMPSGMSFQDGAALFMNYVPAHIMMFDIGGLKNNQSILVHSAGGGVGHAVCQLAKTVDGATVFGTASYNKHDAIKNNLEHLYDHVVDYSQEIRKVSPEGVDIVLDSLCGEDTNKGIGLLKPLGRYILYGSSNIVTGETKSFFSLAKSWWQVDKISPIKLYEENKTVSGFQLRTLMFKQNRHEYIRDVVNTLFQMYNDGKVRPTVDSTWAFEDVGEAMQKMHDRKNIGKIVLDPSLPPKEKEGATDAVLDQEPSSTREGASSSPSQPASFLNFTLITLQNATGVGSTGAGTEKPAEESKEAKAE